MSPPRPAARFAQTQERVLGGTTSGGVAVNDVLLHYLQDDLPFGGIGASGMGSYHSREGLRLAGVLLGLMCRI